MPTATRAPELGSTTSTAASASSVAAFRIGASVYLGTFLLVAALAAAVGVWVVAIRRFVPWREAR